MNWDQLLLNETFRPRSPLKHFDGRDPFENDYSRIISSSFTRRLQDKTQVFPLHESDFIRTRLTHSLEVSSIARSLGKSVEKTLIQQKELDGLLIGQIPSLLAVAGLVHDLGNPPFGHFGESAIKSYFRKFFTDGNKGNLWTEQEKNDFIYFDGNVQTLRILRKLQYLGDEYSYNLTLPTLASIIKYPRNSVKGNKGKTTGNIADKKFGYFLTEEDDYNHISNKLGLKNERHPVVFLLEAADDIAYSAADIEDGVKLGTLDFESIYETFELSLKGGTELEEKTLMELKNIYGTFKANGSDRLNLTVNKFRIFTQAIMIQETINEFLANYSLIMNGEYKTELISNCAAKNIRKAYQNLSTLVFKHKGIIQAELAGWEVIQGLLNIFVPASLNNNFNSNGNNYESRLYNMISYSLRHMFETHSTIYSGTNHEYRRFQLIIDFISGMTDSYALKYYQKLKGIAL
ncbi:dGTP triphosphohydrolase [Chitinophaga filiformis]|uniref:DNTP triphosphohydrolase n=1 Tax=Chitinophaga filiformis TaxID=104663 RepID=A0ABY4IAT1_CHIFI|nr:dNTP triphosphohydrolase [Chitinophaga filiformis]UPK72344.1 dNTP triphosphohydrolase [Chitinophaga filiformis]